MDGKLFPFNWARLLWWLRNPQSHTFRVPLMGVVQRLQSSRLASQLAFMMIEYIRRYAVGRARCQARRGRLGPRRQPGHGRDCRCDRQQDEQANTAIYGKTL